MSSYWNKLLTLVDRSVVLRLLNKAAGASQIPEDEHYTSSSVIAEVPSEEADDACSVTNLGEYHFKGVPRGSVANELGDGLWRPPPTSKKRLENRTLNGGFGGTLNLKL